MDLSTNELVEILDLADRLRVIRGSVDAPRPLEGKSIAVIFEKASTRTRLSFDVAIHELGGHPITLVAKDTQMGRGEPIEDTARMLSGYVHGVVIRTFGQDRLETMCAASSVPVVNGLTDRYHPCQLLADLQTVRAALGRLKGIAVAWVGDGNNMAHSWMLAAAHCDFELRIACPEGYDPEEGVLAEARKRGASITIVRDPKDAVKNAHVVTTDVWASMGQEKESRAREIAFAGFCVDDMLMALADDEAIFLHCLPAHRGEEVGASVLEGPQSRVWIQAENRLHAQKALLMHRLG